jgi:hypothetical protein
MKLIVRVDDKNKISVLGVEEESKKEYPIDNIVGCELWSADRDFYTLSLMLEARDVIQPKAKSRRR